MKWQFLWPSKPPRDLLLPFSPYGYWIYASWDDFNLMIIKCRMENEWNWKFLKYCKIHTYNFHTPRKEAHAVRPRVEESTSVYMYLVHLSADPSTMEVFLLSLMCIFIYKYARKYLYIFIHSEFKHIKYYIHSESVFATSHSGTNFSGFKSTNYFSFLLRLIIYLSPYSSSTVLPAKMSIWPREGGNRETTC